MENSTEAKLVVVRWLDAEDSHETWSDAAEVSAFGDASVVVSTVGWEIKRTKLYITVAGDLAKDGTFGRVCKIPLGMVEEIALLKFTDP